MLLAMTLEEEIIRELLDLATSTRRENYTEITDRAKAYLDKCEADRIAWREIFKLLESADREADKIVWQETYRLLKSERP